MILKELEKLEAKTAEPRLRPAAGKPVETTGKVTETPSEPEANEKPVVLKTTAGLIDSTAFNKLTAAQQRLIISYDNFVGLFPSHERVPELMYNTGARYFELSMYPNARVVYERLLRDHPNSGNWYVKSMSDIVESYRRENNFDSLEVWSERLRTDPNAPDSLRIAGERLASGAIASKATKLSQLAASSGDISGLVRAAEEYIRTARTYPKGEFAAVSLREAGYTYKKAKVFDKAAETWLDLINRYPEITHADTMMWESALAYDALKQYDKALGVYEQFVSRYPRSGFRVDALKNSIYDYGEVQNWTRTAQIYEQYATEFPQDAGPARSYNVALAWLKAKDIEKAATAFDRFEKEDPKNPKVNEFQFQIGQAWIKQGELEKANLAFNRFAKKNPDNPLSVKIEYDVGQFYFERQRLAEARTQFEQAIVTSQNLEKRRLDGNAYYRAESYMCLASMDYPDFELIKFTLPKATLDANLTKKKDLGTKLAGYYDGVILSGSIRGAEAAYQLSGLYEHLGDTWLAQQKPPAEKEVAKRVVQIRDLNEGGAAFYEKAIAPLVAVNIKRAGEYADIKFDTTWTATRDSILSITKVDSTESQWVVKAKQKVVALTAKIAELKTEDDRYLVDRFYDFVTVPKPTKELVAQIGKESAEFLFKNLAYTTGLDTLSSQILRDAIPAYQRMVDLKKPDPAGYNLTGKEIIAAQEHALLLAVQPVKMNEVRILPIIEDYEKLSKRWTQLIDSLVYRPQGIRDVFAFGDQLYAIMDGGLLPMYVDEALKLTRDMSTRYEKVIQKAEDMGIESALVDSLKIDMAELYFNLGMKFQSLAKSADETINRYYARSAAIDSIIAAGGPLADKLAQADATTVLNDMTTQGWDELNFNLRNAALETYEAGYGYKDIYPVATTWYNKIRTQLTEIDPQLYPPPSEEYRFELTSDASWMASTAPSGNAWTMGGFSPDPAWKAVTIGTYPVFVGTLEGLSKSRALPVWGQGPDVTTGTGGDTLVYLRKEFMVFGSPDSVSAVIASTGSFELLVNGLSVAKVAQVDPQKPQVFNLTRQLMAKSKNVIGLIVRGASAQPNSTIVDVKGVDRVPQAAENINAVRQYYSLPPERRTMP